jgi:DNA-binding transcriptional regulator YiaG
MNRCTKCTSTRLTRGEQPFTLDLDRRSFDGFVDGWRCENCAERYYDGNDVEAFEQIVAAWLAVNGVTSHAELKFMRKAAGIRAAELAAWLDVAPETVSHWETGKYTPDVATRGTIAALVLDQLQHLTTTRDELMTARGKLRSALVQKALRSETAMRDRLRAAEKPDPTPRVRVDNRLVA